MNRKSSILIVSVIISITAIIVSLSKPTVSSGAEKILKVGTAYPLSGPPAGWGLPADRGAKVLADMINSKGGVNVAGEKYLIEVVSVDNKATSEGSIIAATRLVHEEKVKLVLGGVKSTEILPMQKICNPEKVVLFSSGYPKECINPDMHYCFSVSQGPREFCAILYSWIVKSLGAKKIAILTVNDTGGKACAEYLFAFAPIIGAQVIYEDFFEPGTRDFTPFLVRLNRTAPDIIETGGTPPPMTALMLKQARELGFKGRMSYFPPLPAKELFEIVGKKNSEGFVGHLRLSEGPMALEQAKEFRRMYVGKYGEAQWSESAIDMPISLSIYVQAVEAAKSLNGDKVRAVLESGRKFQTVLGPAQFYGKDHYGIAHRLLVPVARAMIKDGIVTPVDVVTLDQQIDLVKLWGDK